MSGVNPVLNDESTGGSDNTVNGHGLVLALHLQRQLNSSSKLTEMLKDTQSTLMRNIHCIKPLQDLIQVSLKISLLCGSVYMYICVYLVRDLAEPLFH